MSLFCVEFESDNLYSQQNFTLKAASFFSLNLAAILT